jgi:hypothetical protein
MDGDYGWVDQSSLIRFRTLHARNEATMRDFRSGASIDLRSSDQTCPDADALPIARASA